MKTFHSFKFKFSRVRLEKHTQQQDFKKSMLKKPKLVIFKVSYYHSHFQWRLWLHNYTLSFTLDKIFWAFLTRLSRGLRKLDGQTSFWKNCKTPFFSRYWNFLLISVWNWSKNYIVFSKRLQWSDYGPLNWPGQLTHSKIFKTPVFFEDISNSFHGVTRYGLKPLQFFSFNISTTMIARGI